MGIIKKIKLKDVGSNKNVRLRLLKTNTGFVIEKTEATGTVQGSPEIQFEETSEAKALKIFKSRVASLKSAGYVEYDSPYQAQEKSKKITLPTHFNF